MSCEVVIGGTDEESARPPRRRDLTPKLTGRQVWKCVRGTHEKPAPIVVGAADKWAEVVTDLENLRERATPGEIETARGLLREIIGEVSIKQKPDGIFAYTMLSATGYKAGAQKRT